MTNYVALLRGINVGGSNVISMASLKECFADAGFGDVRTYIQSGNVVFASDVTSSAELEVTIERMLRERLGTDILTVVRSRDEFTATVAAAPSDHGSAEFLSDVLFLKRPLTAAEAITLVPELNEQVDSVSAGPDALYFSRTVIDSAKSRIDRLRVNRLSKRMTVRNWRTTLKLRDLLDGA
ncbi:DUF1697 domain-containing protein [Salinibacterium sp. NK8237]|uniref:DUF1697 domain-containing protein n=1 Tax=Salinibacterium sp. NK8237 TaxID=2792038 RepID=UPI0018CCF7F9|nr:DUF1697 domain-containing protein [Salinibacterium sp. NK8237]MBH0129801.1 DUF1697 domain-containing protein [Salinibacterium sp. NK8237]